MLSIAYFVSPNNDERIDHQLPCVGDQEQLADDSKPITVAEFFVKLMNESYRTSIKRFNA